MECKKCKKEIEKNVSPLIPFSGYCRNCFKEFKKAIENGAVVVEWQVSHTPEWRGFMIYSRSKYFDRLEGNKEANAILKAKKIAKDKDTNILFKNKPDRKVWFIDEYLDQNPEIKEKVNEQKHNFGNPFPYLKEKMKKFFLQK
ncbi:hypothetical protein AKJ57_05310 [candidate division MSBL1 archaeon SCGC-AAA259A05]|uniref:Uncharacterized protein n=1 Tax=candidate division MSBL1 archaeon SCGC-AAA259A05 TaxID=1698259 RepID=A0A133U5G9_9EURY|nr:hypothetical protein AKJ57_05310 [candidate division MSBL1 archaeon SCGC-AAA259A05]